MPSITSSAEPQAKPNGSTVKSQQRRYIMPVVGNVLSRIILWTGIIVFSCIGLGALMVTTFYPSYTEKAEYLTNAAWPVVVLSIAAIAVVALLNRCNVLERINVNVLSWIVCCYMIVAGTAWAIASDTFPAYDSLDLINAAKELGTDDMPMWNGWYMERYPYQMPFVMVIRLLLEMVGDGQLYIALEFLNAICAGATALLLVRLSRRLFSDKAAVMTGLFSFFFLPLFLYSTFAYGNVPSLPFALAAILWQAKFVETNTWRHLIFASMAITVSVLLKSTMIVVLMAMCLIFLLHAMVKRNWHGIAGIIVPIVVYAACSHGFFAVMEKKYDVVTDNGLGKTTWIAMGLQGDEYGNRLPDAPSWVTGSVNPGWYNGYPWGWKTDYNPEVAAVDSEESIKQSLTRFAHNPAFAIRFLANKQATVWLDPTYEALVNGNWSVVPTNYSPTPMSDRPMTHLVRSVYYGKTNAVILRASDAFQFLTLAAAVAVLIGLRQRFRIERLLPITVCLGIFCIYVLWEAKAQYAMPAYVALLAYSGQGLLDIANGAARLMGKFSRIITGKRERIRIGLLTLRGRTCGREDDRPAAWPSDVWANPSRPTRSERSGRVLF